MDDWIRGNFVCDKGEDLTLITILTIICSTITCAGVKYCKYYRWYCYRNLPPKKPEEVIGETSGEKKSFTDTLLAIAKD